MAAVARWENYARHSSNAAILPGKLTMNVLRVFLLVVVLLPTTRSSQAIVREEVIRNQWMRSPNGEFSAAYSGGSLVLRRNTVDEPGQKVAVFAPLFSFQWATNSKTIVTVEHLAGGTCAALIHFNGKSWRRHESSRPVARIITSKLLNRLYRTMLFG